MVNASKQISARERARAASLHFYELEKQREAVQLRYFASMESVDKVHVVRDREIAAAHERAERAAASALGEADGAIRELLAMDVKRSEVQQRLGCAAADVRRATETGPTAVEESAPAEAERAGAGKGDAATDVPAPVGWRSDRSESVVSELQGQD